MGGSAIGHLTDLQSAATESPLRVKTAKAQSEHIESGVHVLADIGASSVCVAMGQQATSPFRSFRMRNSLVQTRPHRITAVEDWHETSPPKAISASRRRAADAASRFSFRCGANLSDTAGAHH